MHQKIIIIINNNKIRKAFLQISWQKIVYVQIQFWSYFYFPEYMYLRYNVSSIQPRSKLKERMQKYLYKMAKISTI